MDDYNLYLAARRSGGMPLRSYKDPKKVRTPSCAGLCEWTEDENTKNKNQREIGYRRRVSPKYISQDHLYNMEAADKDELAAQLAKMKKQLRLKQRQLKKYNKALEAKKHVQETIRRQNTQLSSHGAVLNGDLTETRDEREGRSNDSRIVTFSEKEPEVIYMSPSDQNANNLKGKKKCKREVSQPSLQQEVPEIIDLVEEKFARDESPPVSPFTENDTSHLRTTSGNKAEDSLSRTELITSRVQGIMLDQDREDSTHNGQNIVQVNSKPNVTDELKDMDDYSFSNLEEFFDNSKEGGTHSILHEGPVMAQTDINTCQKITCTESNLGAHEDTDTLLKHQVISKCPNFKAMVESQDLFATPQNDCSSVKENIDIKRRCKPNAKHAIRRLTPESWQGKSDHSTVVSDKKTGHFLENDTASVKINETKTAESDPEFVVDRMDTTIESEFNSVSVTGKTDGMDVTVGNPVCEEKKVGEPSNITEMFETSCDDEEFEEEMMVAAISAEEGVMNVDEKHSETKPGCDNVKISGMSPAEPKGEFEDTVILMGEDTELLDIERKEDLLPESQEYTRDYKVPPGNGKINYQTLRAKQEFGKILTTSVVAIKERGKEIACVLLVHEFGLMQWKMSDKEGNADDFRNVSGHEWMLVDEVDYTVGSVSEMRNIAAVGFPSEDEARYLVILEKFLEKEVVMIYVQLTPSRTMETAVVPVQCTMYEKLLCCSLGEWSIIMYWRPEEAGKDGSLIITDFDLAYSKRSKKWLLQCESNVVDPHWDESLVSLVPLNGTGSEGIILCTTSTEMYVYDALQDVIITQIPWHMSAVCWAVSVKEYLFITSITTEEAQISAVNPINGECETFCSFSIDEIAGRLKSCEVEEAREVRLSGAYYLHGLVLTYSNGTVARIPLTA
ncbi:uncharacterized protein LOC134781814 [Penaeus indicus]|uniref:uncharacterized protein LOC134781814 n=1 Tax=Penaeus indicus TaxID=29960 RepID=UPI00300C1921